MQVEPRRPGLPLSCPHEVTWQRQQLYGSATEQQQMRTCPRPVWPFSPTPSWPSPSVPALPVQPCMPASIACAMGNGRMPQLGSPSAPRGRRAGDLLLCALLANDLQLGLELVLALLVPLLQLLDVLLIATVPSFTRALSTDEDQAWRTVACRMRARRTRGRTCVVDHQHSRLPTFTHLSKHKHPRRTLAKGGVHRSAGG
jgi:hypothetical protein